MTKDESPIVGQLEALSPKMFRLALRYTGEEHGARDVVQQVMIKIWKMRNKLDKVENLESYCMTTVKNAALDHIKKRKNQRTVDLDQARDVRSRQPDIQQNLGNKDLVQMVKKALQELSETQRVIVHLRDIEGYSYKEICEITGSTMDQVKINLHRARQRLRLIMSKKLSNEF